MTRANDNPHALDGFEVIELSDVIIRSPMGRTVRAFVESGNECMGKRYEDDDQLNRAISSAKYYISSAGIEDVKVSRRGDMLLLIRERPGKCDS